jgi:hypothetical protein
MTENAAREGEGISDEEMNGVIDHGDRQYVSPEVEVAESGVTVTFDKTIEPVAGEVPVVEDEDEV